VASQVTGTGSKAQVSQEQQEILRLKKELKQAELERDILKKAVGIFSRNDRAADRGKYLDL
jgi:transposase